MSYKKTIPLTVALLALLVIWAIQTFAVYPATKTCTHQSPLQHHSKSVALFRQFYSDVSTNFRKHKLTRLVVLGNEVNDRPFCDSLTSGLQAYYGGSGTGFTSAKENVLSKKINLQFSSNWTTQTNTFGFFSSRSTFAGKQRSFHFTDDPEGWITWNDQKSNARKMRLRFFLRNTDESASLIWSNNKNQVSEHLLEASAEIQIIDTLLVNFHQGQLTFRGTKSPELLGVALEESIGISSAILDWSHKKTDNFFSKNSRQQINLLEASLFVIPFEEQKLSNLAHFKMELENMKRFLSSKAVVIVLVAANEKRIKQKSNRMHEAQKLIRSYGLCSFICTQHNYTSGKAGTELAHVLRTDHRNMCLRYLSDK
ncbi:MAG: hypothetical protein ACRCYO_00170 [Bacteroidia bacterium]